MTWGQQNTEAEAHELHAGIHLGVVLVELEHANLSHDLVLIPLHLLKICKGDVQKTLPPYFGFKRDPALKNLHWGFWSP